MGKKNKIYVCGFPRSMSLLVIHQFFQSMSSEKIGICSPPKKNPKKYKNSSKIYCLLVVKREDDFQRILEKSFYMLEGAKLTVTPFVLGTKTKKRNNKNKNITEGKFKSSQSRICQKDLSLFKGKGEEVNYSVKLAQVSSLATKKELLSALGVFGEIKSLVFQEKGKVILDRSSNLSDNFHRKTREVRDVFGVFYHSEAQKASLYAEIIQIQGEFIEVASTSKKEMSFIQKKMLEHFNRKQENEEEYFRDSYQTNQKFTAKNHQLQQSKKRKKYPVENFQNSSKRGQYVENQDFIDHKQRSMIPTFPQQQQQQQNQRQQRRPVKQDQVRHSHPQSGNIGPVKEITILYKILICSKKLQHSQKNIKLRKGRNLNENSLIRKGNLFSKKNLVEKFDRITLGLKRKIG